MDFKDDLTDIFNRDFFETEMKRRDCKQSTNSRLIVCGVDELELVNNSFGHDLGDAVVQVVAIILKAACRLKGLVARIGDDKFVVFPAGNSQQLLDEICNKIREQTDIYNSDRPIVPISLSIGTAMNHTRKLDMKLLFAKADGSMLRNKLRKQDNVRSTMVNAITDAYEARDYFAEGHGERLQNLIDSFGRSVGLATKSLTSMKLLARFHDIGKVGIPDNILFKTGNLSEPEWAIIRRHSEFGHRIANMIPGLSQIGEWILTHHEWWNGYGYPLGLAGEYIPFECRIFTIIDSFDVMTTGRPYRRAIGVENALNELRKGAARQYDPTLVNHFIAFINREKSLLDQQNHSTVI